MEVAGGVATSASLSRLPAFFSPSIHSKPSFFLTEHLHWPSSHFATHQVVHSQLLKSTSVSDGNRKNKPFKQNYSMDDDSPQEDGRRSSRGSSSSKWSSQKRLLTLFKQIETSISKEKEGSTNEKEPIKSSKDHHVSFDSVLEALQESGGPGKGQTRNNESDSTSNHKENRATRLPSSFTKKSPITSSSMQRIKDNELTTVESTEGGDEEESLELGKLKLTELKAVAKARGIKGYSKLKKSELVDLLSTQATS